MSVFKRLFARKHTDAAPHSHLASGMSQAAGQSKNGTRRELLRMVLRDTLSTHGIPHAWIGADVLANTSSSGVRSIHLRLVIKHWDPRLLTHSVALQQALIERATSFDPFASEWLSGISWRFALADDSACPPMPEAIVWTSQPAPYAAQPVAARGGSADGQAAALPPVPAASAQDVADAARADLQALMAIRDADFRAHGEAQTRQNTWQRTEPSGLR